MTGFSIMKPRILLNAAGKTISFVIDVGATLSYPCTLVSPVLHNTRSWGIKVNLESTLRLSLCFASSRMCYLITPFLSLLGWALKVNLGNQFWSTFANLLRAHQQSGVKQTPQSRTQTFLVLSVSKILMYSPQLSG